MVIRSKARCDIGETCDWHPTWARLICNNRAKLTKKIDNNFYNDEKIFALFEVLECAIERTNVGCFSMWTEPRCGLSQRLYGLSCNVLDTQKQKQKQKQTYGLHARRPEQSRKLKP